MRENENIEFKKSLSELKESIISVAAILNKHGRGKLWIGIRNDGTVSGMDVNAKTLRDLSQSIAAHIEPRIFPQITQKTIKGKHCILVEFKGEDAPYFAFGKCYMRVADEDRQLSARELERLILAKNRNRLRWDSAPSKATRKDIFRTAIAALPAAGRTKMGQHPKRTGKTGAYQK